MTRVLARAKNRLKEIFSGPDPVSMALALASARRIKRNRHRWRRVASGRQDYNYFRDYEPGTGRYVESDPMGLSGGMNTFAYVGGRPLNATDKFGLFTSTLDFQLAHHFYYGKGAFYMVDSSWCERYKGDPGVQAIIQGIKARVDAKTRQLAAQLGEGESVDFRVSGSQDNYFELSRSWSFGWGNEKWDMRCTATKVSCNCATSSCGGAVGRVDWYTDPLDLHEYWGVGSSPFSVEANVGGVPFKFGINCDLNYATTKCS